MVDLQAIRRIVANMISVGILLFVVIMAVMLLFAVLSNGLVIYCVIKIKKLRTITSLFICNLSVSDILLAGFIMPQKLHDISHKDDFFEGKQNIFCLFSRNIIVNNIK